MALAAIATVQECQVQCVDSRTFCYGLDYSRTSQTCFLIHTVGYELQPIGKIEGTDNYRRILTANGEFSVTMSSGGSGGGGRWGLNPPPPTPPPGDSRVVTDIHCLCSILSNFPFQKILKMRLECRELIAKIETFLRVQCAYRAH